MYTAMHVPIACNIERSKETPSTINLDLDLRLAGGNNTLVRLSERRTIAGGQVTMLVSHLRLTTPISSMNRGALSPPSSLA